MSKELKKSNIQNMALAYLQRYNTTSEHFLTVMKRKIVRRCERQNITFKQNYLEILDDVKNDFEKLGYLNNQHYIKRAVENGFTSGKSSRQIIQKLLTKGINPDETSVAINDYMVEKNIPDPDFIAGVKAIRKKKLGCFDVKNKIDFNKSLQRLAYSGFSYDVSKKVLELSLDEADAILHS